MGAVHDNRILLSTSFGSFEELAALVHAWDTDFRQLRRSEGGHRLLHVEVDGLLMSRAQFGCHVNQRGATPRGFRTYALLEESCPPVYWFGRKVGPDDLLIFPDNGEIEAISRPGFCHHTVPIMTDELADFFERAGGPDLNRLLGPEDTVISLAPERSRQLRAHLRKVSFDPAKLKRSLAICDAYRDRLFAILLEVFCDKAGRDLPRGRRQQSHRLRSVVRMLQDRRNEPQRIADFCASVGLPERSLNEMFRRELGMSPGAFVKGSRLYGVHRELWLGDPSRLRVSDVANSWGFWHMGQFAADYKRFFGERPSDTLRHSRMSPPRRKTSLHRHWLIGLMTAQGRLEPVGKSQSCRSIGFCRRMTGDH